MNISCLIKTIVIMVGFGLIVTFANAAPPTKGVTIINDETNPVPVTVTNECTTSTGEYQVIGVTTDSVPADIGINGIYKACEITFGDGARMCTSKEVLSTPNLDTVLAELPAGTGAWVTRTVISTHMINDELYYVFDFGASYPERFLNCNGWSASGFGGGTLFKSSEGPIIIDVNSCAALQRVTCCAKR